MKRVGLTGNFWEGRATSGRGVSTLEMLLAFSILTLSLSGVIMLAFGNQSIVVDSRQNNKALYQAKGGLEAARAQARKDFDSLVSTPEVKKDIYRGQIIVSDLSPCVKKI